MKQLAYLTSTLFFLIVGVSQAWAVPNCPSYQSIYWSNCLGTHTFASGDKYVGEWNSNKMHGQGSYTFANGEKYVGEWKDDKQNGKGTYTFADGAKYVGEYKDNKVNGQGSYTFANGDK